MSSDGLTQRLLKIEVQGRPTTKQRPRFARGRAYKPKAEKERENIFRAVAIEQLIALGLLKPLGAEYIVSLSMIFVFPIPKSFTKKKKQAIKACNSFLSSPDLDNLIKFVKDALNGVLYADDRQVWNYGDCRKIYGEQARTIVLVSLAKKEW